MSEDFVPYGDDMSPWSENWIEQYSRLGSCDLLGRPLGPCNDPKVLLAAIGYLLEQQKYQTPAAVSDTDTGKHS